MKKLCSPLFLILLFVTSVNKVSGASSTTLLGTPCSDDRTLTTCLSPVGTPSQSSSLLSCALALHEETATDVENEICCMLVTLMVDPRGDTSLIAPSLRTLYAQEFLHSAYHHEQDTLLYSSDEKIISTWFHDVLSYCCCRLHAHYGPSVTLNNILASLVSIHEQLHAWMHDPLVQESAAFNHTIPVVITVLLPNLIKDIALKC